MEVGRKNSPLYSTMFSNIPGLNPLEASKTPSSAVNTIEKKVSKHCQMALGGISKLDWELIWYIPFTYSIVFHHIF